MVNKEELIATKDGNRTREKELFLSMSYFLFPSLMSALVVNETQAKGQKYDETQKDHQKTEKRKKKTYVSDTTGEETSRRDVDNDRKKEESDSCSLTDQNSPPSPWGSMP